MFCPKRSVARILLAAVSAACASDLCAQKSSAATTWRNTGTTWSNSADWSSGIPSSSLAAWFPAAATVVTPNISNSTVTPQGIFIDNSGGGSYSISSSTTISQTSVTYNGTITLGTGSLDVTGGGTTNIKANLALSASTTFTTDTGNTTSIFGKFFGGSGNTITKNGSGTIQFQQVAAPSTSGLTFNLTSGVLEVENNFALGTAPSITVSNAATFQIDPTLNFNFGSAYYTPNGFGDASTQTILQNGATLRDGATGSNVALDLPLYGTVKVQNGAAVTIALPTNGAFDLAQAVQNVTDAPTGTTSNIHVTGAGIFTLNGASPSTGAYTGTWNIDQTSGGSTGITFLNTPTALGVSSSGYAAAVTLTSGYLSDVRSTAASPVPNPITFAGGVLDAKATDGSGTSRTNSYFTGATNIQSVGGSTINLSDPGYSDLSGPVCGMTLSGLATGSGTLYLTAPTINPTSAGIVTFTNTSTAAPNTLNGNLIVQWDTALAATTTSTGSDPLSSATVSLAGGELRLSDGGTGSNGSITAFANNNITLRGYTNADLPSQTDHNGTLTLDNNSTTNTGNVIQLNQLTFDSTGTSATQTLIVQNASATPNYSALFTGTATLSGTATLTTGTNPANIQLAGKLTGNGTFIKAGNNTLTLSGSSNFSGSTMLSAGTTLFNSSYTIGTLSVSSGATASVASGGNKLLSVAALSVASGGTLDLNDNYAIVSSGSLTTIKNLIKTGYANGTWTGSGLTSSAAKTVAANAGNIHKTALGYATASQLGVGSFDGVPVSGSNILIRYTLSGDATLNDTVNSSDFAILAANYGSTNATWAMGDFNYDGTVNALDFNALATNYGAAPVSGDVPFNGAVPDMALSLGSIVPEPSSFCIALLAVLPAAQRRRRLR